ncbi:uncharacterized protein A1O9_06957 [Exophiala aquamarina CBS 119918]|uniref:Uncharacterized protein n=1 Tax=Exophiala aquamarina CBS 119918 TaxID=1182545 RepID=A0A072PAL7_9EURO|nr:uncharacterized protein A1O9_06957 [Exophiala aquamarina CBS 119918]KEF56767.1 hypothetical protein A1O9_06957 [Exophiala aquamarina CBS 119918]
MGFLRQNKDLFDYHKTSAKLYPIVECSMHHRSVYRLLQVVQKLVAQPSDVGFGAIVSAVNKAVSQRFTTPPTAETPSDILSSFMRHGLTHLECQSEAIL